MRSGFQNNHSKFTKTGNKKNYIFFNQKPQLEQKTKWN